MIKHIGLVRETKNEWERRVPIIPRDIRGLISKLGIVMSVQPSANRIFEDKLFLEAGAQVIPDLNACEMILGIKEIKPDDLLPDKIYMFFSHIVKGQSYNMPMLRRLLDLNCTLIDYEKIANEKGMRLIYFSFHAGVAGIIDTMWSFGHLMEWSGIDSPFARLKQTITYDGMHQAEIEFQEIGDYIKKEGLTAKHLPFVIGITGYGNVARGVHHLLDFLPVEKIDPANLHTFMQNGIFDPKKVYTVVFKEEDMVVPVQASSKFELHDYYNHPQNYCSQFEQYLPYMNILVNASYWDTPYPRHVSRESIRNLYSAADPPRLRLIGDISCDIEGGVEVTLKTTDPGDPYFTYDAANDAIIDGLSDAGPVIMSVDNLPSELPRDASIYFSSILKTLIPDLVNTDFTSEFSQLRLPDHLKKAVIVYRGKLTRNYQYLQDYLDQ
jgi:alpha-aminoadipic semialdehyde synthase